MKRLVLLGVMGVALAVAPAGATAATLGPGERLTVVCGKRAFLGAPFERADDAAMRRVHTHKRNQAVLLRRYSDSVIGPPPHPSPNASPETTSVTVRRLEDHVFRLRIAGEFAVQWRGC